MLSIEAQQRLDRVLTQLKEEREAAEAMVETEGFRPRLMAVVVHIKKNIKEEPIKYSVQSGDEYIKHLLFDLDRLRDSLGGAPNFKGGIVTLNDDDANKKFMGQPLSAVKDWFRMTLKKKWRPCFVWRFIAKQFNVTKNGLTQYEDTHIRIQRFGLMQANEKRIHEVLDSKDPERYNEFGNITGLAWHPRENPPQMEKYYMKMTYEFLTDYHADAKSKGDDALVDYYKSFDGVCFEDRANKIELYMRDHPLASMTEDEGIQLDPEMIADWTDSTPIKNVIYEEIKELTNKKGGEVQPTPQELWVHLEKKGLVGREFPCSSDGEEKQVLNAGFLNDDEFRVELFDIIMILEEGPKIIEMPSNSGDVADWSDESTVEHVLFQETQELSLVQGDLPTPQQLWDRLILKGDVIGREFRVSEGSEDKVKLDLDYLNSDKVREKFIEEWMILEEGDKIISKSETAQVGMPAEVEEEVDDGDSDKDVSM
jgi:hypothetical protein